MQINWKKETVFFLLTLAAYTGFYFGLVALMDEEPNLGSYNQTALVFFLVIYLTRAIFVIMNKLKEN